MKNFFKNIDPWGCGILITFIIIASLCLMTSCCTSVCDGKAPALRPMPKDVIPCGKYVIEDIIEIPVTPTCK